MRLGFGLGRSCGVRIRVWYNTSFGSDVIGVPASNALRVSSVEGIVIQLKVWAQDLLAPA